MFHFQAWTHARAIFATPQVLANDLGTAGQSEREAMVDRMALIVVDEAHRASGDYAYCRLMDLVFGSGSKSKPRVLGLTATPGSSWASLQECASSLRISSIMHRSDSSPDVQPYIHQRTCM
jgi:ATP-dependent DNA helicase MPH1